MADKNKNRGTIFGFTSDYVRGRLQMLPGKLNYDYVTGYSNTEREKAEHEKRKKGAQPLF